MAGSVLDSESRLAMGGPTNREGRQPRVRSRDRMSSAWPRSLS